MRIKFLSFIASFFMVSLVITSCLDDDNNIEYSPDTTIHAFELDTIGYGITYKFTIDQLRGLIYNEDSLPVHADTIVDKILIKTLTTASGIVTMKNKDDQDSIININDSIDLTPYINANDENNKYLKIKVWSQNWEKTKDYRISIRKHKYDPDSLKWEYAGEMEDKIQSEQKSVVFNNSILTYTVIDETVLKVYQSSPLSTDPMGWESKEVEGLPAGKLPTSILTFKSRNDDSPRLYATSGDGKVYDSSDGIEWKESEMFKGEEGVKLLLATFTNEKIDVNEKNSKISYIKEDKDGKRRFYALSDSPVNNETGKTSDSNQNESEGEVPEEFPTGNISYTMYKSSTGVNSVLLVGDTKDETTLDDGTATTLVWGYDGSKWVKVSATTSIAHCPHFTRPSIIYYNELIYVFGEEFKSIYVSKSQGFAWEKANSKFAFPRKDWTDGNRTTDSQAVPEFRGRKNYSMVLDTANQYIWILFSQGEASFDEEVADDEDEEESTKSTIKQRYTYNSEVWHGRLNQLWFELDRANAGK